MGELSKDYSPRDIYNMDETGLFFRGSNKKTFHFKRTVRGANYQRRD